MKKTLFILAIIGCAFSSCKSTKTTDYDTIAKELCACMQPIVDINVELQEATKAQETDKVSSLYKELTTAFDEGEKCAIELETKYGAMNEPEQEAKAKAALKRNCPEVSAMINQAEAIQ